jgi:hypothetical protein
MKKTVSKFAFQMRPTALQCGSSVWDSVEVGTVVQVEQVERSEVDPSIHGLRKAPGLVSTMTPMKRENLVSKFAFKFNLTCAPTPEGSEQQLAAAAAAAEAEAAEARSDS